MRRQHKGFTTVPTNKQHDVVHHAAVIRCLSCWMRGDLGRGQDDFAEQPHSVPFDWPLVKP